MIIGVPKETKDEEARVAMTPSGVRKLVNLGHKVCVEDNAGINSGFSDEHYQAAGAVLSSTEDVWNVDLVVKVKEPQSFEYQYLKKQIVFTFFHLAGVNKALTQTLVREGTTAIAYESVEDKQGRLPILQPMSAIAGNMSVLMGAYYLARFNRGNGMQLGTILGKAYGNVVIIGDGVVGQHAAAVACGMGANVAVAGLDKQQWDAQNNKAVAAVDYFFSNKKNITKRIVEADLVIGAVLCRGATTPKIITEKMLKTMPSGSVIVDVSIDQGGCIETSKPTTHSSPVYSKHNVIHYCVSNMPGAYPKASTIALTDVTIGYIEDIASNSLDEFILDEHKAKGVVVYRGKIVSEEVAKDLGLLEFYKMLKN